MCGWGVSPQAVDFEMLSTPHCGANCDCYPMPRLSAPVQITSSAGSRHLLGSSLGSSSRFGEVPENCSCQLYCTLWVLALSLALSLFSRCSLIRKSTETSALGLILQNMSPLRHMAAPLSLWSCSGMSKEMTYVRQNLTDKKRCCMLLWPVCFNRHPVGRTHFGLVWKLRVPNIVTHSCLKGHCVMWKWARKQHVWLTLQPYLCEVITFFPLIKSLKSFEKFVLNIAVSTLNTHCICIFDARCLYTLYYPFCNCWTTCNVLCSIQYFDWQTENDIWV